MPTFVHGSAEAPPRRHPADNDIHEPRTNINKVTIDGRETDLSNRYTELLEKFKKK